MITAEQRARIKWACRRGMLELDVIIMPFFDERFDSLTEQHQQDFVKLLECDDPDLFTWCMKHGRSEDPALANMVDQIIAHNESKLR
ncbi:succinate dehydrogenase assembly factor 2 [Vibrio sp. SS-MA-C1-2]|uniref:FAD assembly factor SdhE n=1 Tax=Vibrio sp. SS-MA-C1-2 TaxID=2908646 RepID=UPI001F48FC1F|nr:succinate dehydrogenase assembly factor 2 [Vibrio sp. SS-MA-C1-2]UJF20070.1 succinate dehydrogenase assembly factor 2 [Vibrio sp. SS-MA-C1-2]